MVRRHQGGLEVLLHDLSGSAPLEGDPACEHVVERGPKPVDVGGCADVRGASDLLRRDVVGGAEGLVALGGRRFLVGDRARKAKVGELHRARLGEHQVLGLHVAVDEALGVRMLQRARDLPRDLQRRALLDALVAVQLVEDRLAVDVLHHEVVVLAHLADVERADDVGVAELRGRTSLLVEALHEHRVGQELAGQDLDGDKPVEAELLGEVHGRHGTGTELAHDLVAGDPQRGAVPLEVHAQARKLPLGDDVVLHKHVRERTWRVSCAARNPHRRLELLVGGESSRHHHLSQQRVVHAARARLARIGRRPRSARLRLGSGGRVGRGWRRSCAHGRERGNTDYTPQARCA